MFKFSNFPRKKQPKPLNKAHEFMEWHSSRLIVLTCLACGLTLLWTSLAHANADIVLRMLLGGFVMGLTLAIVLFYRGDWLDIYRHDQEARNDHIEIAAELFKRRKIDVKARFNCVYVIQDIDVTGYYKIGKSTAPANRIGHFDTMLPFNVRVIHVIEAQDCTALETIMHHHFAAKRQRGEWFQLDSADIAWIMKLEAV